MKKIAVSSLVSLLFLSCSIPVSNNSIQEGRMQYAPKGNPSLVRDTSSHSLLTVHSSLNFSDLEKEYKSFSTKALSNAYVSRMFNKFLVTTPNPTQVIRQLEFARYLKDVKSDSSYFNSLGAIIADDNEIYTKINAMTEVGSYKTANPATFGAFIDNLNPVQAPAVPAGFKLVEKGSFTMGNAEFPNTHQATFTNNLFMGEFEVTQGEWASVYDAVTTTSDLRTRMGSKYPSYYTGANKDSHPVERVSWLKVIAYCNAKSLADGLHVAYNPATGDLLKADGSVATSTTEVEGYRLPTEAEWEFAARGGNSSLGYTYSGSNTANLVAVYSTSSTATVGSKAHNELELHDMSGNVAEWVQDIYVSPYSSSAMQNPYISSGGTTLVARGGNWNNSDIYLRSASHYYYGYGPNGSDSQLGFRISRTVL